ncbi:MAG TPA: rod shape-determining protein MreC [Acetobacteraceae bacterium]|nr:rod shape-determining protein MreC [Acetobacteraceae bacterium]
MIRLSVPARQALAKLTLPLLFVASFGVILLGKVDTMVADRARISLGDTLAPIYAALAMPIEQGRWAVVQFTDFWGSSAENARLRAENDALRRWQTVALALDAENQRLKAELHWVPTAAPAYVTARVVADDGGVYAKAVLLSVGPNHFIHKGQIALDERGLVGRVTDVGARSARVLLITDLNSRIPVVLEGSRARAIMVGTNGPRPRLIYWSDAAPKEGDRVVTSGEANALPPDLPVGVVHYSADHVPEVVPAALLHQLEVVRIFEYGLGIVPPDGGRPPFHSG